MSTSGPTITELPENKEGTTEKQTPVDDEDLDDVSIREVDLDFIDLDSSTTQMSLKNYK